MNSQITMHFINSRAALLKLFYNCNKCLWNSKSYPNAMDIRLLANSLFHCLQLYRFKLKLYKKPIPQLLINTTICCPAISIILLPFFKIMLFNAPNWTYITFQTIWFTCAGGQQLNCFSFCKISHTFSFSWLCQQNSAAYVLQLYKRP